MENINEKNIYEYINNKNKWSIRESNTILKYLQKYQLEYFKKNGKKSKKIDFYIDHMNYNNKMASYFQRHLLTAIATIFLPLSFIVGFFGMNFRSMGAPSLKTGIFTIHQAQRYVFTICFIIIILTSGFFYYYLRRRENYIRAD